MIDGGDGATSGADDKAGAPAQTRGRRRGGGRGANAHRRGANLAQLPWSQPIYRDRPVEPLSTDQLERLLDAAYRVLETIGVEFLSEEACDILRRAGAKVDEDGRALIGRDIVEGAMASAPETFTITPRNPDREVQLGGDRLTISPVGSAPNCSDRDRGRRPGARSDFQDLLKLSQHYNCIHTVGGYPVEPIDIHTSVRGLEAMRDKLILTDKALHTYSLNVPMVEDSMEMARLAAGLDEAAFREKPRIYTNINTNSPLKIDGPMIEGPLRMARRGQATIITPFTLAGAMAPVTVAAAVVQQTAEFLAAATVILLDTPGAPVVMGGFVSNVDMKSGAPAFGTPEYMRGAQIGGQMSRRLKVPYRASNVNAANTVDAQSTWESVFSLWGVITGRVHFMHHGAGWLEGGLVASYEKFIVDCELLQWIAAYMAPLPLEDADLGLEAMAEVGPGGHFFGCAHTQERYETAFHAPFLSDWRNFQSWEIDGAKTATDRAHETWKAVLADFKTPPMDDAARGALDAFVEKRIAEGGVKTDF